MTEWTSTMTSLVWNQLLNCLMRQSRRKQFGLVWWLTNKIPQGLHVFTMRPPHCMPNMRKKLSTFNFLIIHMPPLNQSYRVDLSIPFLCMVLLNTSPQILRISKWLSTSWLSTLGTNRSTVVATTYHKDKWSHKE